jgi:GNAT superfamily N-acetyltransferase
VERLAAFTGEIHGVRVVELTRRLILNHPSARREYWPYLALPDSGEIVANLCLIPWIWQMGGVELHAGEMGIVGTRADWRGQGLQQRLNAYFTRLLNEGDFDLSHIQGIPYFYRQFGYEYAIPLEGGLRLELHSLPEEGAAPLIRPATAEDIPHLAELYATAAQTLDISARRDTASWHYLLGPGLQSETAADTWLLLNDAGQIQGYWRVQHYGFSAGLNVCECSQLNASEALAVLRACGELARRRGKPFIRLNVPGNSSLARLPASLGAHDPGRYAWQIRLPEPLHLLRKIQPLLEKRLAASAFAGLSQDFVLNSYRQAYRISFAGGKITALETTEPSQGDLQVPPNLLAPLLLGQRTITELQQFYPDVICRGSAAYLAKTLFPRLEAFLYTPY